MSRYLKPKITAISIKNIYVLVNIIYAHKKIFSTLFFNNNFTQIKEIVITNLYGGLYSLIFAFIRNTYLADSMLFSHIIQLLAQLENYL